MISCYLNKNLIDRRIIQTQDVDNKSGEHALSKNIFNVLWQSYSEMSRYGMDKI